MTKTNTFIDFDAESFLSDNDVGFAEQVKNVGSGWIGIEECPICGTGGYHFAINKESKIGTCWVCGESCSPPKMISLYLNIDIRDAYKILNKYSGKIIEYKSRYAGKDVISPTDLFKVDSIGERYLKKRKYDVERIIKKYKIQQTGPTSFLKLEEHKIDFRFRLFVPIYMNREFVSYVGRDLTEKSKNRYQNPIIEACKVTPSSCIYNIDTVKEDCIIVEGVTDVWRLGDGSVSMQGVKTTPKQIKFLAEKKLNKVFILFDLNANREANKLANSLSGLCKEISIVTMSETSDPGELSDFDALKLKHQLLGV
jgi:DNA primase